MHRTLVLYGYVRDGADCVCVDAEVIDALDACGAWWRGRFSGGSEAALDVKQGQRLVCIA